MNETVVRFLTRLETADHTLTKLSSQLDNGNLTPPNPDTGEQWDLKQIWAHMVEFVPFWQAQAQRVLASGSEPIIFGRTLEHEGRVTAIERDRGLETAVLHAQLQTHLLDLRRFIQNLSASQWKIEGQHPAMGTMTVSQIVNRFLLGHLESHVTQLQQLLNAD